MSIESALAYHETITKAAPPTPDATAPASEATPPVADATTAQAKPTPEAPDPAFERLARKESDLQAIREQNKKERESNEAEKKRILEAADKLKRLEALEKYEKVEELRSKDIVAAMRTLGFTEQDIAKYYQEVAKELPPEEIARKTAQEVIDAENKKRADEKAAEDKKTQQRALDEFRTAVDKHLTAEPEKLEYCNYYGDAAKQLIEDTVAACLEKDGELIPVSEAAEMVEQFYEEQDQQMSTLKKRSAKAVAADKAAAAPDKAQVAPKPAQTTSNVKITPAPDGRKPVTLTNRLVPTVQHASTSATPKNETPEAKKERLIAKYLRPQG